MKTLDEIKKKIQELTFLEEFDYIVGIARGGIIPAVMLQQRLGGELKIIWINYRNEKNTPSNSGPKLLQELDFDPKNKTILLVDDRTKTGTTFDFAKKILKEAKIVKTFNINGKADYALYDESCFPMPWRI